jgi:hypothetical protein
MNKKKSEDLKFSRKKNIPSICRLTVETSVIMH